MTQSEGPPAERAPVASSASSERRWPRWALAVAVVVVATALIVMVLRASAGVQYSTADIGPNRKTVVSLDGTTITIPKGAVDSDGRIRLESNKNVPKRAVAFDDLVAHTPAIAVTLQDAKLTGRAEVRMAVPKGWDRTWQPIVVWEDGDNGWQWLPTEISERGSKRVATATTGHFSNGFLAAFDLKAAAARAAKQIGDLVTGRAGVEQPKCDREDEVRKLLAVKSDSGDGVKWCLGMQGNRPVLKVANNHRTLAQVQVLKSARVLDGPGWGFSVERLVDTVGLGLEIFAAGFPDDRQTLMLRAGKTISIEMPTTAHGGVDVTASSVGYLLSILVNAVDMYSTIAKAARLPVTASGDNIWNLLGDGAGKQEDWAEATTNCLKSFTSTYTDDIAKAVAAVEEFKRALKFAGNCGAQIGKASIQASGPLAWLASATAATVATIVGTVFSLVEQFFAGIREAVDGIAYGFGASQDDPVYTIVTDPKIAPLDRSFLGTKWSVHGGNLEIREDGTALALGHGVCPDVDIAHWCNDVMELRASAHPEGVKLTVTKTYIRDEQTGATFPSSEPEIGTYFVLRRYDSDHLITARFDPNGVRYEGSYGNGLGNPYLCAENAQNADGLCGA